MTLYLQYLITGIFNKNSKIVCPCMVLVLPVSHLHMTKQTLLAHILEQFVEKQQWFTFWPNLYFLSLLGLVG